MDVCFWNKCNNHCLMCTNPEEFRNADDYQYEPLYHRLLSQKEKIKDITMTGGEPTIHPEFTRIVDFLKKEFAGREITLLTNGRRFSYPGFARKCLEMKNFSVCVSLHGYNAQTHDKITLVRGSFEQAVAGMVNILRFRMPGQKLIIRIVVTKLNAGCIHRILDFIKNRLQGIDKVAVIFMEMEGLAEKNLKTVGITYTEWKKQFGLLEPRIKHFNLLQFYHFPLCVVDKNLWKYVWRTLPEHEITFVSQCQQCWCKVYCLGIHKAYLKLIGDKEFMPPDKIEIEEDRIDPVHHPIAKC